MLKITPEEYLSELKDVEYVIAAMNGKIELIDLVDKFDYKENTENAKALLKEAIDKIESNVFDEASVEVINRTIQSLQGRLLDNLKNKQNRKSQKFRLDSLVLIDMKLL